MAENWKCQKKFIKNKYKVQTKLSLSFRRFSGRIAIIIFFFFHEFRQILVFTTKFFVHRLAVPPNFSPPSGNSIPPTLRYLVGNSAIWHRCYRHSLTNALNNEECLLISNPEESNYYIKGEMPDSLLIIVRLLLIVFLLRCRVIYYIYYIGWNE